MEIVKEYCESCGRNTDHIVLDINDGVDSWMVAHVKCSECNNEKNVNINS